MNKIPIEGYEGSQAFALMALTMLGMGLTPSARAIGVPFAASYTTPQSATLPEIVERSAAIATELETLTAEPEWTEEQRTQFDTLNTELTALEARQADIATRNAVLARAQAAATVQPGAYAAAVPGAYTPPAIIRKQTPDELHDIERIREETRTRSEYDQRVRDNALRSIEAAPARKGEYDGLAEIVERSDEGEDGRGEIATRVLVTGAPAYRSAFNKYLAGKQALWSPEETRAAALAVTGTTTTGGYAVPYVFDPTMMHIGVWTQQNPFRAACRTVNITNGNNWRTVTVGAITAAYQNEAAAAVEGGPTFGQPSYTVQTASAFATLSVETMQDRPDITGELASLFGEAKDTLEENKFAVGAGTGNLPLGMFYAAAYTPTNTATNDTTAIADTQLVEAALPLRFRARAEWFMNRSTIRQLLALDTTQRYFSGAGIQFAGQQNPVRAESGNTGLFLLGYPVWEVPSAVSTLTTDQALIAALVDPQSYVIVDRIGMNVEVIPQMLDGATPSFPTLQRGVICYWRNTAKPINADAGRVLRVQ